jgi:ubiquinone/menaquinone biosynthesis C-methylase UbiE
MDSLDSTRRFSDRVADYVRCRPGYPDALRDALRQDVGVAPDSVVADIGSGTGISTAMLLELGATVFAIEPNAGMRQAAEDRLGNHPRFRSVAARAEETTLTDCSVDIVTAGQSFHWFPETETRAEFMRILRPGGTVALFWNTRRSEGTPFLAAYERLLQQFGTDYAQVQHRKIDPPMLRAFFGGESASRLFVNAQTLDFDGLLGRLSSSSYAPGPSHPDYARMVAVLQEIFDAHHDNGLVRMEYDTELFFGRLERSS